MKKVVDYKIVYDTGFIPFDKYVMKMIDEGYELLGSPIKFNHRLCQPMVMYEDET